MGGAVAAVANTVKSAVAAPVSIAKSVVSSPSNAFKTLVTSPISHGVSIVSPLASLATGHTSSFKPLVGAVAGTAASADAGVQLDELSGGKVYAAYGNVPVIGGLAAGRISGGESLVQGDEMGFGRYAGNSAAIGAVAAGGVVAGNAAFGGDAGAAGAAGGATAADVAGGGAVAGEAGAAGAAGGAGLTAAEVGAIGSAAGSILGGGNRAPASAMPVASGTATPWTTWLLIGSGALLLGGVLLKKGGRK